jgi:hypothetical protein
MRAAPRKSGHAALRFTKPERELVRSAFFEYVRLVGTRFVTGNDTLADTFERERTQPFVTDHGYEVAAVDQEVVILTSTAAPPM